MVQDRPAHFTLHHSCLSRPPITVCLPGKLFKRCPVPAHGPISSCALQEIAAALSRQQFQAAQQQRLWRLPLLRTMKDQTVR